jgi:integrase
MNQRKRRSTYQYGTLVLEKRSRGPNVWVYRYFEIENGKKRRRKSVVGTQEEYPTRSAAERAAEHLRLSANAEINKYECPTMRGLIDRYIDQVLRPCLDVPVGGAQDSASAISYHCAMS